MSTDEKTNWPRVAVMGAGAVGCYFGGMLARAGAPVTFIGRPAFVDAVTRSGLILDTLHFQEKISVPATSDVAAVGDADMILFCVKTLDTRVTSQAIAPYLKPSAVVASLQNGVDNVEQIHAAAGIAALPCVVYVAAAMPEPGRVKHSGRGDLAVGQGARKKEEVARFAECFERAGVKCRISENIAGDLWAKLVWNCAGNALTALGRASYGQVAGSEFGRQVLMAAAEETMQVARAAGVALPPIDLKGVGLKLAQDLGPATSSTAQDIARGKRTEVDSLNGFVARRGEKLGVPTPVNRTLHALIKLLEETFPQG